MRPNRCAADGSCCGSNLVRRDFLKVATAAPVALLSVPLQDRRLKIRPHGPASTCVPRVKACFVRRAGEYGMRWPGSIYDGEAARRDYTSRLQEAATRLGVKLELRPEPIHTLDEGRAWVAEAVASKPDGLFVVTLDRQEHTWPTVDLAIASGLRTVVFSPIGTSFTTNTAAPSRKPGAFIASTSDFAQAEYGLKMLGAAARLAATRCLVIAGDRRVDRVMPHLGIQLHHVPAREFLEAYNATPVTDEVRALASELIGGARSMIAATEQDVINGIKSYLVASRMLEAERCDAITMDCLGALGDTDVSLPCIAWSRMNDDGIPAACEADLGAVASHCVVQYLFDRPGFQQDPVAETALDALVGAHCSCPTRLHGFGTPPEPYDIQHHHAMRDATARTLWMEGQRMTSVDVLPGDDKAPTQVLISSGTVLKNVSVPPAGGCVVSVAVKLDGVTDYLAYPGFHQVFIYGDFKKPLTQFCQLMRLEAVVV